MTAPSALTALAFLFFMFFNSIEKDEGAQRSY